MELFDVSPVVAVCVLAAGALFVGSSVVYFVHSAPPTTITISSGPEGSTFQKSALKYAQILERSGVKVNVLKSEGSFQNLQRLADPSSSGVGHVDVAFAQAGLKDAPVDKLVSLGSVGFQPLMLFYRGKPLELLSELKGKRVAVGPVGSGSRNFALALLEANGIKEGEPGTTLLDWEAQAAADALLDRKIDAAFVMSESASTDILHKLLHSNEVELYSFKQANAYSRKIDYLNVLDLPEGAIDFGLDIPKHDVMMLAPMVELVATKNLHPALSDLLLEAAMTVHSKPGIFQHRGQFPTPIEHAIRISDDASRFYKSGKSLFYRYLPFWLASLTSRVVVVFLPMLVILIPAMRSVPAFFRWRTQRKIHLRYRELLLVEKDFLGATSDLKKEQLRKHFDSIDATVNRMKIPASFADQFYGLRGHIDYVREMLVNR